MPAPLRPLRVLVADDTSAFHEAACEWIRVHPADLLLVASVHDGAEAVAAEARLTPDLVLMDVFMPHLNGFEASRRIKSRPNSARIILLSLSDGSAMESAARAAGADAFLPKSEFAARLPVLLSRLFEAEPKEALAEPAPVAAVRRDPHRRVEP